jgi:hypothetical protein
MIIRQNRVLAGFVVVLTLVKSYCYLLPPNAVSVGSILLILDCICLEVDLGNRSAERCAA